MTTSHADRESARAAIRTAADLLGIPADQVDVLLMPPDDDKLPAPLVPADVDLRGMPFMPLELAVLRSTLFVKSTGEEFKAAFALWCASWHEIPAATLPDDLVMLSALSHVRDAETFERLMPRALHGWKRHSDGRLHHAVVSRLALQAWEKRSEFREERDARETRQQRWRDKLRRLTGLLRDHGVDVPHGLSLGKLIKLCADNLPGFDPESETVDPSRAPSRRTSTGRRRETGKTETEIGTETETGTETGTDVINRRGAKAAAKASRKRSADHQDGPNVARATRIAKDWALPATFGNWALEHFPHWSAETVRSIGETFRDHWSSKPGRDGLKLDWFATWRNWCKSSITQRDFPPPRNGRSNGHHAPAPADLAAKNRRAEQLAFGEQPSDPGVIDHAQG